MIDVLTVGNAIVDVIASADDEFLSREGIVKGAMNLIDSDRADHLHSAMDSAVEASGGCAANTAAGVAGFGGSAAYFGKVADDSLGEAFRRDMHSWGVRFETPPLNAPPSTARSMIFVTPDGERSMNTYLGACVEFEPADVDGKMVSSSRIVHFEGYLWDPPRAREAIRRIIEIAGAHSVLVSMTLSDSLCVDRHRDEFLDLIRSGSVSVVLANEAEAKALYLTDSLSDALDGLRSDCVLSAVTRSEKGSIATRAEERSEVPAFPVERVVDATGAGDMFASGFLYGLAKGKALADCSRLGSLAASMVIRQIGPRPRESLQEAMQRESL